MDFKELQELDNGMMATAWAHESLDYVVLDETVQRFANNPIFQTLNLLEVDRAAKASQDLESIVLESNDLKKTASRLSKSSPND